MFNNNLNKDLETVTINLSEILTAEKNHVTDILYDRNISYRNMANYIEIKITANNKNYIIICDKINSIYNIEIHLFGNENGNLIVENNQKYTCYAKRAGKGNGHCIVSGIGEVDSSRSDDGNGNALQLGNGKGSAQRYGKGNGHAIKTGSGDGSANHSGNGKGNALRLGSGNGSASISRENNGYAIRLGSGSGYAISYNQKKCLLLKLGKGKGDTRKAIQEL